MVRIANQFRNPANGQVYSWTINHNEEEQFGKRRSLERIAPTGLVGPTVQQGDDSPMRIVLNGTILHRSQMVAFKSWFQLSKSQSIIFTDFAGDSYEVLITAFEPLRQRTLRNMRDPSIPYHYWTYRLEMEVLAVLAGTWEGVTP